MMDDRMALFEAAREPVTNLFERFLIPPFSILDRRQGYWQDRRRAWLTLGIQSELGRGGALTYGKFNQEYVDASTAERYGEGSTSIFDPVLCELAYRWFSPVGGTIIDPFAGGSVRGIVAAATGREYVGYDLSGAQIAANRDQARAILGPDGKYIFDPPPVPPTWVHADARAIGPDPVMTGVADMIFTCPPYGDLEVYSDDPRDLSTMKWDGFLGAYREIIAGAVGALKRDRFAAIVVSEVRDKAGRFTSLPAETVRAFEAAGAAYYNEAVIVDPAGTAAMRAGKQFDVSRKICRVHQSMLVFVKGDPRVATAACGDATD